MDLRFSDAEEAFRRELRDWLEAELSGPFREVRGRGGPGDEHHAIDERRAWERHMGRAGWSCVGWPRAYGGRDATLHEQVIFHEEYARARAPGRLGHIGETLLGPTLVAFGTEAQKQRFLPPIVRGDELWCQGYSEPDAGSDLANVRTRAELRDGAYRVTGQKVWTSLAHIADFCFVIARTDPGSVRHKGLSYLLVAMKQPGVEVRPIVQMTGTSEFNEVFFDGARCEPEHVVGELHDGWRIALATLAFERGASTLGQQLAFENELREITDLARANGRAREPAMRQRLAHAWMGLRIMRLGALRTLSTMQGGQLGREAMIAKLYWATWHRELGKLAMDVLGDEAELAEGAPYQLTGLQRLFLFTRSDTIYAGSNEIQKNLIAERALGLPPEPKGPVPGRP